MAELGCPLLLVCSNVSPDALGGVDRAADDFRALGERAAARGLKVGFEALAWGRHVNDYRDSWEIVRRADHPAIGLVLDSFHIFARNTDLKPIAAIPRDKIFLVQLADAPRLEMDVLQWSRHFRNLPGQGDLPLLDFMGALHTTGYDDLISLEIFNDQFRAGSARAVAVDGHRSLIYLLDQLRRRTKATITGAPPLPDRATCRGVQFVEFAIDQTTAPAFERLLGGIGFRLTGQHKSKAVARWQQGDVNVIVNTETEGFAHSFNITHGTSVCALALRVDDAAATLDRAQLLLDRPFRQAVGPGEIEVPAVRGLGGSLLYFVDQRSTLGRHWEIDFDPVPQGAGGDAALVAVDHVSQSMQYEEMLSWMLFYGSLLNVEKIAPQDVLDPGGVVRSQVLETPDGALRIVLNASQSARTLSSRFLTEFFGSGVQHVAFTSRDIYATAAALQKAGIAVLPIPENYYDDIEAKWGLEPALLDRLRAGNILYDRDGDAEYLQIYTPTFEEKFFFELVERRGFYRGYGAANAPIRLAAQTRLSGRPELLAR
jgi:4-hydroxyphenylpyruvate dioxygenase